MFKKMTVEQLKTDQTTSYRFKQLSEKVASTDKRTEGRNDKATEDEIN